MTIYRHISVYIVALLLSGCAMFGGGPPTVTVLRSDVEKAQVRLAYLFGRVEQWAEGKCAEKTLTSRECRVAKETAAMLKGVQTQVQASLDAKQGMDLAPLLGTLETLVPLLMLF